MAASGDVSKTVKPDRMILSMNIDWLNLASVNGAMLNLNKNWIDLAPILQYSNEKWWSVFGKDLLQVHRLFYNKTLWSRHLPKLSFFGEHNTIYKTCLKT